MASTLDKVNTQVYRIYVKATPEQVWDAIVKPEYTDGYGYGGLADYDLRPGGSYRLLASEAMKQAGVSGGFEVPDVAVDGEVIDAERPARLVLTWRLAMSPEVAAEGFTPLRYEISGIQDGVTRLTVSHDLAGAPQLAALVAGEMEERGAGGGWNWVLSGLKTLLETGQPLAS
jgi:uncharacterized protein YndB with AHSA1/START domain